MVVIFHIITDFTVTKKCSLHGRKRLISKTYNKNDNAINTNNYNDIYKIIYFPFSGSRGKKTNMI